MKKLDHPCIIKFLGALQPENEAEVSIITEYMQSDLQSLLLSLARGEEMVDKHTRLAIIITGIVIGMQYIQELQLIHRDLKPGNILLDASYYPKITDFGTTRTMPEGGPSQMTFTGTLIFMAPEIRDSEPYDGRADIYAFGLVTIGENTVVPSGVQIGKNTALSGVTVKEDYPNGVLESGETLIKAGERV